MVNAFMPYQATPSPVMSDVAFLRGLTWITIAALLLPPITGSVVLVFVGLFPFPNFLGIWTHLGGIYVGIIMLAGILYVRHLGRKVITIAAERDAALVTRLKARLQRIPFLVMFVLGIYYFGGVLTANSTMTALGIKTFDTSETLYVLFAVSPSLLITVIPILFYLNDHLGRYLGPRHIVVAALPSWLKLTVLGLFTPVLVDTLLITYYADRTGYVTVETILLWGTLIIIAGIGTLAALRSFQQSLSPARHYLATGGDRGSPPVPCSLDEIGMMTAEWRRLMLAEQEALTQATASETRFSGLVTTLPVGVLECDTACTITFVNPAFCKLHSLDAEDLIGIKAWELAADPGFAEEIKRVAQKSDGYDAGMSLAGKNRTGTGQVIDVTIDWAPRFDDGGQMIGHIAIFSDITEKRKAAEELLIRDAAIRGAGNAMAIADLGGRITFANDPFLSLFGYDDRKDVIGQPMGVQWRDQDEFKKAKDNVFQKGSWQGELISGGNGRPERIVDVTASLTRSENGDPLCVIANYVDVTDQKRSENYIRDLNQSLETRVRERTAELEAEKKRTESYLNVANTMIVALDRHGDIQLVNDRGSEVLGWDRADLIGRNWFDTCIPESDRALIRETFGKVLNGQLDQVETFENEVINKQGEHRLITWHNAYFLDGAGVVQGCLSAGQDITEERKAEEKLETNERRFSLSRQFAGIAVWEWNLQTNALYWSEQIAPLIGYTHGEIEVTYDNFLSVVPPEDRGPVEQAIAHCLETGEMYEVEHRIIRADDGRIRWILERGNVIHDDQGRPHVMVGVAQDVTDRKVQEEAMRHAQKIESLGNLAGGVAHSLNNLLLPVTTLTRLVLEDSDLDAEHRSYLSKVVEASDRARDLVSRILAFSRFEPPKLSRGDLADLVNETIDLASSTIPSSIYLEWTPPAETFPVVMDPSQIEAVLMNIVNNAASAVDGHGNGRITIVLDRLHTALGPTTEPLRVASEPVARLVITDNGQGMDAETLARVFDPFFTTKPVGKGTGLGMSMAHGIIREHGGTITIESQPNKGTSVCILLPMNKMDPDGNSLDAKKDDLEPVGDQGTG